MKRDRALCAVLYVLALRISEALRLTKAHFKQIKKDKIIMKAIELSKRHYRDRPRKEQFRIENFLPLTGPRAPLTELITDHLELLGPEEQLFPFGRKRAYQIVLATLGIPEHWLRAYGDMFLYEAWNQDILAVSDYTKQSVLTLQQYIRRRFQRYQTV